jgi:hypothetical protein
MKNTIWLAAFIGLILTIIGLKNSIEQEQINKEYKFQIQIDSLYNIIDSLYHEIDTLIWENEIWDNNITNNTVHLLSAIIRVESRNNDSAYCVSEDAVGCLQIRKCMVDDVNRILKRQKSYTRFTYDDRWLRHKSIEMFNIYCNHYGLTTAEEISRCWNGGPRGMNNPLTADYWRKVQKDLAS